MSECREPIKVRIFQSDVNGGNLTRENLLDTWKEKLSVCPELDVSYYGRMKMDNIDEEVGDADAVIGLFVAPGIITKEFLDRHPRLRYIATLSHGFGSCDKEEIKRRGITYTNTVSGDVTIAQYAMAMLLDLCNNVAIHDDFYKHKIWSTPGAAKNGVKILTRQFELYGKTIGIIGLGSIGYRMAVMAQGFGMKVIAYSRHKKCGDRYAFIEQVTLDELLKKSDVISIHCPLTEESRNMIDADAIAKMKDGVILINTARGEIIDENALKDALDSKKVSAAGLDVVCGEPLDGPIPLMQCDNTRITQHIAFATPEAKIRAIEIAADNLINWYKGTPTSVIV